jgi:5-methylcytosine-specific restriction enzyme A
VTNHRSAQAKEWRKLYNTKRWKELRRHKLTKNPLCALCLKDNKLTAATVVHHKQAHKGNEELFFDFENLESLCAPHHDRDMQREEALGYSPKVGVDGWPVDKKHPFNKAAAPTRSGLDAKPKSKRKDFS